MDADSSQEKDPAPKPATPPPSGGTADIGEGSEMLPAAGELADLLRRHREVSETLNRSMLALLTFCLFCWLTLGSPDRALIVDEPTIKIPFIDVALSFFSFLIVAPFLLIVFTIYLHVFLQEGLELEGVLVNHGESGRAAMLFNFNSRAARFLTEFIFYWLVPVTLLGISWKAQARVEWGAPMFLLTAIVTLGLAYVWQTRSPKRDTLRWWDRRVLYAWLIVISFFIIYIMWIAFLDPSRVRRPIDLYRANLEGVWLHGSDLAGADLRFANLAQADLTGASLRFAKLHEAVLRKALLIEADLTAADLTGANLSDANVAGSSLRGANLARANLEGANLAGAGLLRADLTGANLGGINLARANLYRSRLADADLQSANLTGAYLQGVNLEGSDLTDANVSEARFAGVGESPVHDLTQAQIDGAWAWADQPPLYLDRLDPPLVLPEARLCDPALRSAWIDELSRRPEGERSYGPPAGCSGAAVRVPPPGRAGVRRPRAGRSNWAPRERASR